MDKENVDLETEVQLLRTRLSALEQTNQKRGISRWRLAMLTAASGLCGVLVAPQLFSNTPPSLITFTAGEPAVAADVNANFEYLEDRLEAAEGAASSSVCEALGGYWTGSACEPFMLTAALGTPVTGEEANKWTQCTGLDTANSNYIPCSPFQGAALASMFGDFQPNTWYWLQSGGQNGQGGLGVLHRASGGVSPTNAATCPAGHSASIFYDWGTPHVDGIECRANTLQQPVLCCRQPSD